MSKPVTLSGFVGHPIGLLLTKESMYRSMFGIGPDINESALCRLVGVDDYGLWVHPKAFMAHDMDTVVMVPWAHIMGLIGDLNRKELSSGRIGFRTNTTGTGV